MKNINVFVVDTCVARSAGIKGKEESANSYGILMLIFREGKSIALDDTLYSEWDINMSSSSRKWYASMLSKRKIIRCKIEDSCLKYFPPCNKTVIIKKDIHLIDLAYKYDKCIISNENKARKALIAMSKYVSYISTIAWINPIKEYIYIEDAIKNGGKIKNEWYLQ